MNCIYFYSPVKWLTRVTTIMAVLFFSLGPDSVNAEVAGAAPLYTMAVPTDNFGDPAGTITSLPQDISANVTSATDVDSDPQPIGPCSTTQGNKSLNRGRQTVWFIYTPTVTEAVSLDTNGSDYDTFIAVWTKPASTLNLVKCNEDTFEAIQAELFFTATAGTTYYIEVGSFSGYWGNPVLVPSKNANLLFHVYTPNTNVTVGSTLVGSYYVPPSGSKRKTYLGINSGPVKIENSNALMTIASQRVIYGRISYSEIMGFPADQLTDAYIFPYYNNVAMDSQLRVSNLGNVPTDITVTLAGQPIDSYTLGANSAIRKNYAGKNSGPLKVTSSTTNILTTIRVLYGGRSYSELMGFPANQLTKQYIFPWYNNVAMDSQLRVSNLGDGVTTINVYLGASPTPIDTFNLNTGGVTRKNYAGKNSGPLRVTSSATNILTTIRVLYANQSFSELMGFPSNKLSQEYWYPVYDNVALDSQLRVSNLGNDTTMITVYAGDQPIDSYRLEAGRTVRRNYPTDTGPLHVVSDTQPILTTIRLLYKTASFSSLYEMMGLPVSQLSTRYYFPWYNNTAMDSQIRFAVP